MRADGPIVPLAYVAHKPRPGDSVWGIAAFALAAVCATLPAEMAWQLVTHARHDWGVYSPYAGSFAAISFGVNWPWYLLDTWRSSAAAWACSAAGPGSARRR